MDGKDKKELNELMAAICDWVALLEARESVVNKCTENDHNGKVYLKTLL